MKIKNVFHLIFFGIVIFLILELKNQTDENLKPKESRYINELTQLYLNDLNIIVKDLDGNEEKLTHNKGEIIVINIWGTGCSPCIKEIPGLNKLVNMYKSNSKVKFIALSSETPTKLDFFLKHKQEFNFDQKIIIEFPNSGYAIPRNILCNQNGKIVYDGVGAYPEKIDEMISVLSENPEVSLGFYIN